MNAALAGSAAGALALAALAAFRNALLSGHRRLAAGRARGGGVPEPAPGRHPRLPAPPAPAFLAGRMEGAGLDVDPQLAWAGWCWGTAAALLVALAAGPGLAMAVAVAALTGPPLVLRLASGRGDHRYQGLVPAALEAVARSLRSGAALRQALGEAAASTPGPVGADLVRVVGEAEHGLPLAEALGAWAGRRPLPAVRLAAAALALGTQTGGAQARAIDGVAATVRERLALAGEVRALTSQSRTSAVVIALAPLAFCGFAATADARVAAFLFRSPAGMAVLVAGLALDTVGAGWMAALTRARP